MKSILILGAGRSSSVLISYLLDYGKKAGVSVVVGDVSEAAAKERIGNEKGTAIQFDIADEVRSAQVIKNADVVVSLMPAHFHHLVARICVQAQKHLLTASYVSPEMQSFHQEAKSRSVLLLNECGLDPGIDHMSAMQVIDKIREQGGRLVSFESFTGGLIAPETDVKNPWRYKFTWNARNVVMAGQGTAKYLQNKRFKYIPYQQLFKRVTPVTVPGFGEFEGYANRDSLKYIETYGLQDVETMLRGTLRNEGFCSAWNVLVQLGCCDDTYQVEGVSKMSHAEFIRSFVNDKGDNLEGTIATIFELGKNSPELQRLRWSGLFDSEPVGLDKGTPAQILEHILNKKWKLNPADKDLVVMWHRFGYELKGVRKEIQSSLIATGTDSINTAMARTVGLPLGIAAKLILENKLSHRGVTIPTTKEFYLPILEELKTMGIELHERETL